MQLLEKELGVDLFDRSSRSIRLTPAGKSFHADATATAAAGRTHGAVGAQGLGRQVRAAARRLHRRQRELRPGRRAACRPLGHRRRRARPSRAGHHGSTRSPVQRRAGHRAGATAGHPAGSGGPNPDPRALDRGLAEGPPAGPSRSSRCNITDLHGADFIMYNPIESRYFNELLSSVLHAASVAPVVVQYMVQIHSIVALVNLDWGVAVVPESASKMQFDNVVYRPLDAGPARSGRTRSGVATQRREPHPRTVAARADPRLTPLRRLWERRIGKIPRGYYFIRNRAWTCICARPYCHFHQPM